MVFLVAENENRQLEENLGKLRELDTQSRVCITLKKFPSLEYLTEKIIEGKKKRQLKACARPVI